MSYERADLRSFLAETDAAGLTLYIDKPVDVASQIAALCSQTKRPTMFRNLKGFEDFRVVDGLTRFRETQAIAMGLEPGDPSKVMSGYLEKLARGPGPTEMINDAPINQIVWTDDEVDLTRLPVPIPTEGVDMPHLEISAADFLTPIISGGMGVTKHPDGKQNTFFTMAKIVDKQRIQFFMLPSHTAANVEAWGERGERCPMALVIGCHPLYEMGASFTGPHDEYSELNIIAGLFGKPIPTTKAETLDLEIPALAEIVIEGFIDPNKARYLHASSHSDSYAPIFSQEPFFDVTAITMRENPIYRHIQPNKWTEHHSLSELIVGTNLLSFLRNENLPVKDIHMPLQSCANCAIIQMTPNSEDDVKTAMQIGLNCPMMPRLTIIVDEDVDIYDMNDVLFALSVRSKGKFGLATLEGVMGMPEPLTTLINSRDDIQPLANNRWAVDATKPPLNQPNQRLEHTRLTPRGEPGVQLADFLN